jgi:hypothetical protein
MVFKNRFVFHVAAPVAAVSKAIVALERSGPPDLRRGPGTRATSICHGVYLFEHEEFIGKHGGAEITETSPGRLEERSATRVGEKLSRYALTGADGGTRVEVRVATDVRGVEAAWILVCNAPLRAMQNKGWRKEVRLRAAELQPQL